jgi:hypothetical protein
MAGRPSEPDGDETTAADDEPVLPAVASEDRDEGWGDEHDAGRRDDDWYRRERPPHHE